MEKASWIASVCVLAASVVVLSVVLPLVLRQNHTSNLVKKNKARIESPNNVPVMSDMCASRLYKLIRDFKSITEPHHLHYWIVGGTLIGALRHQGLIPWDDDLDIAIRDSDVSLFLQLEPLFQKLGYYYKKQGFGYKIVARDMPEPNWIDIFVYMKEGSNFVLQNERHIWPKEIYTIESVNNRVLYKFGDDYIYGPGHAVEYLNRAHGTNWNNEGYFDRLHGSTKSVNKTWVLLEQEYQPAGKKLLTYH
jgi:phosphorylcholine metabolism protein LicD